MGHLEQFAQRTFAEETERVTAGAAGWQDPPEIRLERVQADGFLIVRRPQSLEHLAAPWPQAQPHDEVMLELKLPRNHLDRKPVERALLRRQARQLQRLEEQDASWRGEEPLWLVAPHLPEWLEEMRQPVRFAPGCYWIEPQWHRFLWIAANELPLLDELIPFLLARSGQALDEFGRWVAPRRPLDWTLSMLEYLPMSTPTRQELLSKFGKVDDPEIEARRQHILRALLEQSPETKQELIDEGIEKGRLSEARAALRRVLARRQLAPSKDDDARIEACTDLAVLERWLDSAVTAVSVSDVLG
ncbi:MAG: hypothetical protein E6J90_14065 [Deltaproteobacteria bacterium]|nr:MAG: hypothetical protein E6J90_14065 [Deltaproteobacteria bacterium]